MVANVPLLSEVASLSVMRHQTPANFDTPEARALNEEASRFWGDKSWMREQADLIAETLDFTSNVPNIFSQVVDTRTVGEFDRVMFTEKSGFTVYWTHRGGILEEVDMSGDQYEIGRDTLGFSVREFTDKLRAGWAEQLSTLLNYGKAAMVTEINRRLISMMVAATASGSGYYVDATGTGLTAAVLGQAIRDVSDAPAPAGVLGPNTVTVMGRAGALAAIADFTGYSQNSLEEIERTGSLAKWRGANLVELPNILGPSGSSAFSDKDVYVFTRNVGHIVLYGGHLVRAWEEDAVDYSRIRCRRDAGISLNGLQRGYLRRIRIAA